jgi:hypothetical protein
MNSASDPSPAQGPSPNFNRSDLRFFLLLWGTAALFQLAVLGLAHLLTPPGRIFLGDLQETYTALTYRAWSLQFAHHGPLADNPAAITPAAPAYFNLVWFLMGRLLALGIPWGPAFIAFRLLSAGLMILGILLLCGRLSPDRTLGRGAAVLATFGTGFGWVVPLWDPTFRNGYLATADLIHADAFPVHTLWTFPHMSLAHALVVLVYWCMIRAVEEERRAPAVWAAALMLLLGFVNPYHYVTIGAVLGIWFLALQVRRGRVFLPRWADLGILFLGTLPSALYFYWLTRHAPNFAHWRTVNVERTWGLDSVLLGYAPFLLLALPAYLAEVRGRRPSDLSLLLLLWPPLNLLLHFGHPLVFFENRLGLGLVYPLSLLAVRSWRSLLDRLPGRWSGSSLLPGDGTRPGAAPPGAPVTPGGTLALALPLLLFLPTTFFHIHNALRELRGLPPTVVVAINYKMTISRGEREALDFLSREARDFPLVLSWREAGALLPAVAPVRSYLAHSSQAERFLQRMERSHFFFALANRREREMLLKHLGVGYVWWGPDEDGLEGVRPDDVPALHRVFDNGEVAVYRVDRSSF